MCECFQRPQLVHEIELGTRRGRQSRCSSRGGLWVGRGVAIVNVECFMHVPPPFVPLLHELSLLSFFLLLLLFPLIWYFRIWIFSLDSLRICASGLARATLTRSLLPP